MSAIRLLLVDDEAALTDLLKKYLERIGYAVDSCGSADEALALFGENPQRYDLVLTDLTLPGMSGEAMLEKMRERDPEMRAIVASGYPYQPRLPLVKFLQKPFLPKNLAEVIEEILKDGSNAS